MNFKRVTRFVRAILSPPENWLAGHYAFFAAAVLGMLAVNEIWQYGADVTQWDSMLVSGAITFVSGIGLARSMPSRTEEMLTRLVNRGALQAPPEKVELFKQLLSERIATWAHRAGLSVAAAILIAFLFAFRLNLDNGQLLLTFVTVCGGYVAGRYLGRAASYEGLGRLLKQQNIVLKVQPAHLDGAAGLKPVGDLLFFQAMLLAIPAGFLAVWWIIIPIIPNLTLSYSIWRDPYVGLLAVALTFEVLAFVVPMWSFHQEMINQKLDLLKNADELSQQVTEVQTKLVNAATDQERKELKEELTDKTERYWAIEQMPTWPVDGLTRKHFTLSNAALFTPLISQFVHVTGVWEGILKELPNIFGKFS